MSGGATVHPLHGNQMAAVHPEKTVWLSASAGTGKTQVLSSRVLRLLLQPDVEPSQILCLTFTKAGATEMAARISGTLAEWVRLPDMDLFQRLEAIGAPSDPDSRNRARTLFAEVLDCPGGGLRIDTIHAFSQWLLAAFPREAGLVPGTRPMEDRERALLARQVLADLLVAGDAALLAAAEDLSLRMGPDAVEAYLLRCASAREAWFGTGAWQVPMRPRLLALLGLPSDAGPVYAADLCANHAFDVTSLRLCMDINRAWKAKGGQEAAAAIGDWLAASPAQRLEGFELLRKQFLKATNEPKSTRYQEKVDPDYPEHAARVVESIQAVMAAQALLALADWLEPALTLGRAFALAWEEAKQREGLIDFDDQIRQAAALLKQSELADWIRYKLDRRFDHILVDEAQDTNQSQWDIILAIAEEFWAGLGAHGDLMRTLFVVGDYKQAIFRFQGTSPENFRRAADKVRARVEAAGTPGPAMASSRYRAREFRELGLDRSFRTAQHVLDFVDRAIAGIGHAAFGLDAAPEPHEGQDRPGYVALWEPVGSLNDDADDADEAEEAEEEAAQNWLSQPDRQMAERIAQQVKQWIDPAGPGFRLHKGAARRAGPGDVMVLVRKRKALAGLIVARLHAAGVPVAGVDRLRLGAPLAVKDLVAALRFAAQPLDDLNLANLMASPLIGWSQKQILEHAYRPRDTRLWEHLRRSGHADALALREQLGDLLRLADVEPPQGLLHWLLVGPWQGRRKLVARLGHEANDPIDELVNAAHAYAATGTPSLTGFLAWFDAGDGELKREAENAGDLVRVMTVHGSKGLQAPIVILADATGNPDAARDHGLDLPDPHDPKRTIPLPSLSKADKHGRIAEADARVKAEEQQEHWRLLYVAMTRAEEALFIGGALGPKDNGAPAQNSWFARLAQLFPEDAWVPDAVFGRRLDWGAPPEAMPATAPVATRQTELALTEPLPRWLSQAPAAEPRPPRPLAPSSAGEDDAPDPPWPPGSNMDAARRGTLMHRLLERLPEVDPALRVLSGQGWLARHAAEFDTAARDGMLADAMAVIDSPEWADLFAPGSLAEVPIAAVVGERVIAGTIDRLAITPDRVRLVDYKTARRPPASLDQVPRANLRQMAAYASALEAAYPDRRIEVALLYTAVPRLIVVPDEVLAVHKPDFTPMQ